jgi:lipid-A-disaccharide synthase-like uncharacterized protein
MSDQPDKKRLKWEPAAAMLIVLGIGLWLALGPASRPRFDTRPTSTTLDIRIGDTRGILETTPTAAGPTFRILMVGVPPSRLYTADEIKAMFGSRVYDRAIAPRGNLVFKYLNITSWTNLVWVGIGLGGQVAFSGRMLIQWFVSERRRQSVITESFWWFSLIGAVTLFSYFVWRQDPVGILGQASGIVIYARNLRLISKHKHRQARRLSRSAAVAKDGQGSTGGRE